MTFISGIFYIRIINEFLNLQACTHSVNKPFIKFLLARTNSRMFTKIKFLQIFPNITVHGFIYSEANKCFLGN